MSKNEKSLTHERLKEVLSYSEIDGHFRWLITRGNKAAGSIAGTLRPDGYISISVDKHRFLAHRLAVFYVTGIWPPDEVDHEEMNRSDNRWEKIRNATHSQNNANRRPQSNNKLGVKGVRLLPYGNFQAYYNLNGKQKSLGVFTKEEDASAAFNKFASDNYGEFARVA